MKCSYCLNEANYKCSCQLPYMCPACLGGHLVALEGHPFENINIGLETSRLSHLKLEIHKRLRKIKETRFEIISKTNDLIKFIETKSIKALEQLEAISRNLIDLSNHERFSKSEITVVEKIESENEEHSKDLEEILKSISLLNIITQNQEIVIANSGPIAEFNQGINIGIHEDIKQVMCPNQHLLTFFPNIKDRMIATKSPILKSVFCDICKFLNIQTSWTCIECKYDLCEMCFAISSQNSQVSDKTQMTCLNKHQLVCYNPISSRISANGSHQNPNIRCNYCKSLNLKLSWSCVKCDFDLCKQCSDDEIYSKSASSLSSQLCPSLHPLSYYQTAMEFNKRKKSFNYISCSLCNFKWTGGSWTCRICNFYLCLKCTNLKISSIKSNEKK